MALLSHIFHFCYTILPWIGKYLSSSVPSNPSGAHNVSCLRLYGIGIFVQKPKLDMDWLILSLSCLYENADEK